MPSLVYFDLVALRRRYVMHEMDSNGTPLEDIANRFGITERVVRYHLDLPKPRLARPGQGEEWRDWAACNENDTHLFYPESRGLAGRNAVRQAQKICAGCPVKKQCHQYAIENYETNGVWGGEDMTKYRYRYDESNGDVYVEIGGRDAPLTKVS